MRRKNFLTVSALVFFLSSLVSATTVLRLSLIETVDGAEAIVDGRVLATEPIVNESGMICTRVTLRVNQYLKGSGSDRYTFVIPGGEVNGLARTIPGFPRFRPGEDSILFLTAQSGKGLRMPVGLAQGKYHVAVDAVTGRKTVKRSAMGDLRFISAQTGEPAQAPQSTTEDYETFCARVKQIARRVR